MDNGDGWGAAPPPQPGLQPGRRAKLRFAVLLFAAEVGRKTEKRLNDE